MDSGQRVIYEVCWKNPDGTYGKAESSARMPSIPEGAVQVDPDEMNAPLNTYRSMLKAANERDKERVKLGAEERLKVYQELIDLGISPESASRLSGHSANSDGPQRGV